LYRSANGKWLDVVNVATLRLISGKSRQKVNAHSREHFSWVHVTRSHSIDFLLGFLSLPEHRVGVGSGGPPLKKPIFYASSAMLTLWEVKSQSILMSWSGRV
jgi:hypothetical protein